MEFRELLIQFGDYNWIMAFLRFSFLTESEGPNIPCIHSEPEMVRRNESS